MTDQLDLKSRPKAALHQTIRNIASNRVHFRLSHSAIAYLRLVAEKVSPDDIGNGRTPWCYERVDDLALALAVDPRTIRNIEKRLHDLKLIERKPMSNGHRHARRCYHTGELLYAHGISLAPILRRAEEITAIERNRADREYAYRTMRQKVHAVRARLRETLNVALKHPALADLCAETWKAFSTCPARFTRTIFDVDALARIHATLTLANERLAEALDAPATPAPEAGDNSRLCVEISDAAEINYRHKYLTTPSDLYSCKPAEAVAGEKTAGSGVASDDGSCGGTEDAGGETGRKAPYRPEAQIPPRTLLDLAPGRWRETLGDMERVDWSVIGYIADARRAELGIGERAWTLGVRRMGASTAALCLMILDTNREHPTRPVRNVGGAFVAMTRRFAAGTLNLDPSVRWIAARRKGARMQGAAPA